MSGQCEAFQEKLSAYIDGELAGDQLRPLQDHLDHCPDCRSTVEEFSRVGSLLREEIGRKASEVDFTRLRREILKRTAASAAKPRTSGKLRPFSALRRPGVRQLAWALGAAMVIALLWLGPWLGEGPAPVLQGEIQERLGQAIRDGAGLRYAVVQASGRQQEELGLMIRDHSYLRWSETGADQSLLGALQERMGRSIRDFARSQLSWRQQSGQLQEEMGRLIQAQARQETQRL